VKVVAVIPARYAAQRLPGKPLADILGKPMIQHVFDRVRKARGVDRVVVATDDERIAEVVRGFGGEARMTSTEHASGTDRVAEIADAIPADVYVNIQGDEPLMSPRAIEAAVDSLRSGRFTMSSVMTPIHDPADLENRAVVKVIVAVDRRAIYFSRFPIPYSRGAPPQSGAFACYRHVGLYAYTIETLRSITRLAPSPLERGESLEQLRALQSGVAIGMAEVDFVSIGVDTPEELEKVKEYLRKNPNG